MNVAFDIKNLWLYGKGIGTFTLNLLGDLASHHSYPETALQLHSPSFELKALNLINDNPRFQKITTRKIDKKSRLDKVWYDQVTLLSSLRRHKTDVLFSPYFDIPLLWNKAAITTIHDLSIFEGKDAYGKAFYYYYKALLQKAIKQSSAIITVSDSSKQKILETFAIPEEKINVFYNKVPSAFVQEGAKKISDECYSDLQLRYNLPSEYILYTGGLETRKNISLLVEGIKLARQSHSGISRLVITGVTSTTNPAYEALLKDKNILLLGYLPYDDLVGVYNLASLVVNTSSYEGFGIPVLESLTLQKPILCSNIPVYKEIGKDCAYYFASNDQQSFKHQLISFFQGKLNPISRTDMTARAGFFNHKNYADRFYQLVMQSI